MTTYAVTLDENNQADGLYNSDKHDPFPAGAVEVSLAAQQILCARKHQLIDGVCVPVSATTQAGWRTAERDSVIAGLDWAERRRHRYDDLGATQAALTVAVFEFVINNDANEVDRIEGLRQQVKTEIPKPPES